MTHFFMDADAQLENRLDGEAIALDSIALTAPQIDQALQLTQTVAADQQWQTYLSALALTGFEQWLSDRAPDLTVRSQPPRSDFMPSSAVSPIRVGDFQLCLLTVGSLSDVTVPIPTAAIDTAEAAAHLYILLEVQEEQEQVLVKAALRSDQLQQRQQLQGLTVDDTGTYAVPINWFETDANDLLLYLRCLDPSALPLGGLRVNSSPAQLAEMPAVGAIADVISTAASGLVQGAMNAGLWLHNQLDAIAQELTWVLLPPAVASAMRYRGIVGESAAEQFELLITELKQTGMQVPAEARGAYRDLRWGNVVLRLYAVAWALPAPLDDPEWSLLVVLGAQSAEMPVGVKLQIRDQDQVLVEHTICPNTSQAYLYGRVIGTWNEQFWVTVDMANGAVVTFPPFRFDPNED